jgi:hypothetical protein
MSGINKNVIFYTVYNNKKYEELLFMSLKSLAKFQNFDIIIFSNFDISISIDKRIYFEKIEFPEGTAIPMGYRFILMNNLLKKYECVLHTDCDTIFINDPNNIFQNIEKEKINISSETNGLLKIGNNFIVDEYWAGPLLTTEEREIYKEIPSICCGVFAGKNILNNMCEEIYKNICYNEQKGFFGTCYDQHSICEFLIKNNLYSFELQKYVSHNGCYIVDKDLIKFMIENNYVILHYAGGIGPHEDKIKFMKKTLEAINE